MPDMGTAHGHTWGWGLLRIGAPLVGKLLSEVQAGFSQQTETLDRPPGPGGPEPQIDLRPGAARSCSGLGGGQTPGPLWSGISPVRREGRRRWPQRRAGWDAVRWGRKAPRSASTWLSICEELKGRVGSGCKLALYLHPHPLTPP